MTKSMKTPGARVRGLGSAHEGTDHFWKQRVTGALNLVLLPLFVVLVIVLAGRDHAGVAAILGQPLIAIPFLLALLSVAMHMRLGMQMIIEDYIHTEGLKVLALIGNTFFTAIVALAAAFSILKISFGG